VNSVENRSFCVKDGILAENACRVRSSSAPIALIAATAANKPAHEAFAANPRAAIRAILTA
jgi:hypothetical protein